MSRLALAFARVRESKKPGLVTYVTAGDPTLPKTRGVLEALDRAGADVLEVGVPFSDPLADGPVIQRATERALASHTTLAGVLDLLGEMRGSLRPPVVILSSLTPPMSAFASIRYGSRWYYIDDADAASKRGLSFVMLLMDLTQRPS